MPEYRTSPAPIATMPPGVPYIVGNEAAERFSFYGMKAILTVYMTQFLVSSAGSLDVMSGEEAKKYVHLFVASAYFFPIAGAILSDWLWGKYSTILWLSIVYCLGHLALAVVPGREGLFLGLFLIALGAGGIKPCVSAHVGDQFGEQNQHLLTRVFGWFYFSINFGAFFSTLLTPWLLAKYGHEVAFGVPGVLMFVATVVFWMGRNRFVHIPPAGERFIDETFSPEGLNAILRLIPLYLFVAIFWALYDQTASAWVLQAEEMNRNVIMPSFDSEAGLVFREQPLLSSQLQAINPILVLIYIPLFSYVVYPLASKVITLTPLRKVGFGFFLTAAAFAISGMAQSLIDAGAQPHISWQVWAYIVLTAAEILVSITCLEFSYTQAPNRMKSFIMSLYLLSVSLGNVLTSGVNAFIENADGTSKLPGATYYWFFTTLMVVAAVLFVPYAVYFREKRYLQTSA
ncbi:MAG: POT family MFS transporter [Planctomycetaceae bacterium]|nr:POT family MFS transporter [Planctomycetaceae bacterium]